MKKAKYIQQRENCSMGQRSTHVLSIAHYGTSFFEGIRCYETPHGPCVFRLDEHIIDLKTLQRYTILKFHIAQKNSRRLVLIFF